MANYVGETIAVRSTALDPASGEVYSNLTAEVIFYAPGKNPKANPADRSGDAGPFPMTFDALLQVYVGLVDTTGWVPGRWSYRVNLLGSGSSWEYGAFQLKA